MVDAEPSSNTVGEYNIGQDNIQLLGLDIHNPVFAIAALTIVLFVVFPLLFQELATTLFDSFKA